MRAAVCPEYGPPEVVRIEEQPSPAVDAGQVRVQGRRRGGQLSRRAAVANQYQISVPPPFVPGSEFAGVDRRNRRRAQAVSPSATGSPAPGCTAPSPRRSWCPPPGWRGSPTASTTAPPRRSASRTGRRTTRCGRWRACRRATSVIVLGAGGGVGLAAVQLGVQLGADGHRRRVVGRKARCGSVHTAPSTSSTTSTGDLRAALRGRPARTAPTPSSTRSAVSCPSPRCDRCGRGGRFVTVGYASGVIPRIPLNLVLVKGVHVLGFQFQDVAARRIRPQRGRTARASRQRPCAPAHRRGLSAVPKLRARCGTSPTATPSARC